jgi:hypothetical protein
VIQNQRLDMMSSMEFDKLIVEIQSSFWQMLINKRDYYLFLCNDFVDLEILEVKGRAIVHERDEIEKKIKRIIEINPDSPKGPIMAQLFIEYFDVQARKLKDFTENKENKMK